MFADDDFVEFALWLIDDLPPGEQQIWWRWLKMFVAYRVFVARPWSERFSVN